MNYWMMLRKAVHEKVDGDLKRRIKKDPTPLVEEFAIGCFLEAIEPQVVNAVMVFNRKGYSTWTSGFSTDGRWQFISGPYRVDSETQKSLQAIRANVRLGRFHSTRTGPRWTTVDFKPSKPDIQSIEAMWDQVASVLPDTGHWGIMQQSAAAWDFRKKYAPSWEMIRILELELFIASGRNPRWRRAWEGELRKLKEAMRRDDEDFYIFYTDLLRESCRVPIANETQPFD